ncbi:hypothetical protein [Caulobacter sp.]|uniref:hypothetical protein n=1 Tax=Caulobacter sp. TaxID=78 RepID=UPI003BA90D46
MKQAHPHPSRAGAWMAGVAVVAVVLTLWMAWQMGGAVGVPPALQFRAPAIPSRSVPNPEPSPLPISPRPR